MINESLERLDELSGEVDDGKISEFVMEDSFCVDIFSHLIYLIFLSDIPIARSEIAIQVSPESQCDFSEVEPENANYIM